MRSLMGGGDIGGRPLAVPEATKDDLPRRDDLQRIMTAQAGVLRDHSSLEQAAKCVAGTAEGDDLAAWELRNLATVGRVLCAGALAREESRGAHTRSDFEQLDADLRIRFIANA
jgi:L-aspartate oxidase